MDRSCNAILQQSINILLCNPCLSYPDVTCNNFANKMNGMKVKYKSLVHEMLKTTFTFFLHILSNVHAAILFTS